MNLVGGVQQVVSDYCRGEGVPCPLLVSQVAARQLTSVKSGVLQEGTDRRFQGGRGLVFGRARVDRADQREGRV